MSKKHELPPLSPSEQVIMDQLWKLEPIGLLDLLAAVNEHREEAITRATLQTQLTRLEQKGWIKRDDSERAHVYTAAVKQTSGKKRVLTELRQRLFGGSSLALVRCLVESGQIPEQELQELRKLVSTHLDKNQNS